MVVWFVVTKVRLKFQLLEKDDFDWLVNSGSKLNTCPKLPLGSGQANWLGSTCPSLVADGETSIEDPPNSVFWD